MGVRRQLDFILASAKLPVITFEITRAIDMGSDHRAVKAIYHIGMPRQIKKKQKRVRRWKAQDLKLYHEQLNAALTHDELHSSKQLTNIIAECGNACSSNDHGRNDSLKKPWLTNRFNELVNQRRLEQCKTERSRLSKLIARELRTGMRKWKTEKLQAQLALFKDIMHTWNFTLRHLLVPQLARLNLSNLRTR